MRSPVFKPLAVLGLVTLMALIGSLPAADKATSKTASPVQISKVEGSSLPNLIQVEDDVLSGGVPEGDKAFAELQQRGVKTIISVDGMTPDLDRARKYGLRYVHLPHGYDGIPTERVSQLCKALNDLPGPVYIHCHHGKHRSPTAAAVACVGTGRLAPDQALEILKTAGTNPDYRGLYQIARTMQPLSRTELASVPAVFPDKVELAPLTASMVEIDAAFGPLKQLQTTGWNQPAEQRAQALLLVEQYRELQRLERTRTAPEDFRSFLADDLKQAEALLAALQREPVDTPSANHSLKALGEGCARCHKQFRDNVNASPTGR